MKTDPFRNFDWWLLVIALLVLLALASGARADTTTAVLQDGPRTVTVTVTAAVTATAGQANPPYPTFWGSVTLTVTFDFSGPVDGNQYDYYAAGAHAYLGMPYYVGTLLYNFQTHSVVTVGPMPVNQGWTSGQLQISGSSGTQVFPSQLNGSNTTLIQQDAYHGFTTTQITQIRQSIYYHNGDVTEAIYSDSVMLTTVDVPLTSDGWNAFSANVTIPPGHSGQLTAGLVAPGYTSGPGTGLTYTGNLTDKGGVPAQITQGGVTGPTAQQSSGNIAVELPSTLINAPVLQSGSGAPIPSAGATAVWVNPRIGNTSYTSTSDVMTLNGYQQGVQNLMISETNNAQLVNTTINTTTITLNSTIANGTTTINNTLNNIANKLDNLGNTSGNGTGNTTGNTSGNTDKIEAWAQRGNDASGNSSAFTRGTDPNANAAAEGNMSSNWTGALGTIGVQSTIPNADFSTADPSSVFRIAIPSTFGGGTIDFNPFRTDRLGPVISGFRTALAWLAVVSFAIWALRETFAVIKDSGKLSQIVGPKVIIAGESDGGLVTAATYILLTAGAVAVLLAACVAIYDTNWPILGQFAALFSSGPFHSFPAQAMWMLDQVFPVATCVAAMLGRLTYIKLLALAYVVYMAFYKSKPA